LRSACRKRRPGRKYALAITVDRLQIRALDRAPVAQVVAQKQRRRYAAGERRHVQLRFELRPRAAGRAAAQIGHGHVPPQPLRRQRDRRHDRAFARHREVEARTEAAAFVRRMIVDDVDAADERERVVNHGKLAVQPPQQLALEPPPALLAVDAHLGA
jgi:hypothetical protein